MTTFEHTKALTDAEIDADLVGDGGRHYAPDDSYPEYGNGTVRWAYRLGVEEGASAVPALVAAVERVQAIAAEWATQPTDYDEDTEQQIEDGKQILAILEALETP